MSFTLPTIHTNGTSPDTILEDNLKIHHLLQDAITAINLAEFNARDYYPVQGAWQKALSERCKVSKQLADIATDFLEIAEHARRVIEDREDRRRQHAAQ